VTQQPLGPESLLADRFFEGDDMKRINGPGDIVLANYHHDISSDRDEIWMGDVKMAPIRKVQSERAKTVLGSFPNFLRIHWARGD
jgi:hypothetical protein